MQSWDFLPAKSPSTLFSMVWCSPVLVAIKYDPARQGEEVDVMPVYSLGLCLSPPVRHLVAPTLHKSTNTACPDLYALTHHSTGRLNIFPCHPRAPSSYKSYGDLILSLFNSQ